MPRFWLFVALIVVIGLGCSDDDEQTEKRALRIGAVRGLSSFELNSSIGGSSAAVLSLIADRTDVHVHNSKQNGKSVLVDIRPESHFSAAELAESFRYVSLESARARTDSSIELQFSDEESASQIASLLYGGFAVGPFELAIRTKHTATLRRKKDHVFSELFVQEMSTQDEWRLFLGGRLDALPQANYTYKAQLEQMPSMRIVEYPPSEEVTLFFNTTMPSLSSSEIRTYISNQIDRSAISRVLFDDKERAALVHPNGAELEVSASDLPTLSIVYLDSASEMHRAAEILRFQLAQKGIKLSLTPLPISELMKRCESGEFGLALLPLPIGKGRYDRFLSDSHPVSTNFTGYHSKEYDAAFDRSDVETMRTILVRDLPATPLYTQLYFTAVRNTLCLGEEPTLSSWRWMAAIYPCDETSE